MYDVGPCMHACVWVVQRVDAGLGTAQHGSMVPISSVLCMGHNCSIVAVEEAHSMGWHACRQSYGMFAILSLYLCKTGRLSWQK